MSETGDQGRVSFLTGEAELPGATALLLDLRERLTEAGYAQTEVLPHPGSVLDLVYEPLNLVRAARHRSNALAPSSVSMAYARLHRRPRAAALHRLFASGATFAPRRVERLLGRDLLERSLALGLLTERVDGHHAGLRSEVVVVPHRGRLYVADALRHRSDPDYCYIGRLSFAGPDLMTRGTPEHTYGRVLDLGCGAGVGAVALADRSEETLGTDLVERCVWFGTINAAVNGIPNARFRTSDLFDRVDGDFDLVLAHPPGVWTATTSEHIAAADGGEDFGLAVSTAMISGALRRLRPGGSVVSMLMAPVVAGRPYVQEALERICADRPATVTCYPLLEYYDYGDRAAYREHRISKLVRYLAVLRPAEAFSLEFARLDTARLVSARLRSLPARSIARLGRRRGRATPTATAPATPPAGPPSPG